VAVATGAGRAEALAVEAEMAIRRGDLDGARRLLDEAVRLTPGHARAHNALAVVHWRRGDRTAARAAIREALGAGPPHRAVILNGLRYLDGEGLYEAIREPVSTYLDRHPDDDEVRQRFRAAHEDHLRRLFERSEVVDGPYRPRDYRVTAIVSTYASEEFIGECLSDLEGQTIADDVEVIVVDAASPQDERRLVQTFQDRYTNLRYLRTPERIGVYPAWNLACWLARGRYLTPASTNDRLWSRAYEVMADTLDARPEVALVYGDSDLTELPHQEFGRHTPARVLGGRYRWPEYSYADLLFNFRVGAHPLWRRSVHAEVGYFDERYVAIADQDFWLRLGRRHKAVHIPEVTGLMWMSQESLSWKPEALIEGFEIQVKHHRSTVLAGGGAYTPAQLAAWQARFAGVVTRLIRLGEARAAAEVYRRHRRLFPADAVALKELDARLGGRG
jgi:hypothetical protein